MDNYEQSKPGNEALKLLYKKAVEARNFGPAYSKMYDFYNALSSIDDILESLHEEDYKIEREEILAKFEESKKEMKKAEMFQSLREWFLLLNDELNKNGLLFDFDINYEER